MDNGSEEGSWTNEGEDVGETLVLRGGAEV